MESLYSIYFAGEVMEGQDPAAVREALGRLFKADDATLDKLFSGQPQSIKRNCDKATALKYKQAMENAGARPLIKSAEPAVERPLTAAERIAALAAAPDAGNYPDTSADSARKEAADDTQEGDFDLAAAGADVLKPEERGEAVTADIDTGDLEVDATATRLSQEPPPPPPSPDTSHLSMGEVGEDIPVLDSGVEPLSPNTDALSLSPEGTDFADCAAPEPVPPAVDLSGIDLAPEGSDVLEEQYRRAEEAEVPETDHISLEN
jgi:hypothetical protein